MTTKPTHTPCRAILNDSGKTNAELYEIRDGSGDVLCYVPFPNKDRAAYIVRAVNAHEEILEALCLVDAHFKAHFGDLNWEDSEICSDIRRAIAKAEGQ